MLERAITCYVLFVLTVVAAGLSLKMGPERAMAAIAFWGRARFGNILIFYSLALLIAPFLLAARAKWGMWFLVAAVALIWMSYPLVHNLAGLRDFYIASLVIGTGDGFGPSLLQGITFIVAGMLIGRAIEDQSLKASGPLCLVVIVAAGVLLWFILDLGPFGVVVSLAEAGQFRGNNHPAYYAYGILTALSWIGVTALLCRLFPALENEWIIAFGYNSLFAYTAGNIILNLSPRVDSGIGVSLAIYVIFLSLVLYLTVAHHRYRQSQAGRLYRPIGLATDYGKQTIRRLTRAIVK